MEEEEREREMQQIQKRTQRRFERRKREEDVRKYKVSEKDSGRQRMRGKEKKIQKKNVREMSDQ